jgi:ABC-2 type transport system ATP-binding protein
MSKLIIDNLTFGYERKKRKVFQSLSFSLEDSGIYGLLGKNGAGKSTLIHLIMGMLTPTSGEITIDGINVRRRLPNTLCDIYIIPEEYDFPKMSLEKYVHLNAPFYPKFSVDDMKEYLRLFDMDSQLDLHSLSMGQKKKALMSFALATHCSIILMDEPTNGLDIPSKSQFRKIIASSISEEQIILISTHQVKDVEQLLDHIIIIDDSEILLDDTTQHICDKLCFVETDNKEMLDKAISSQPTLQGYIAMLPNTEGLETSMNLELLFNGTLAKTEEIKNIMNTQPIKDQK